jgi:phosphoribosylformylglycinamidine cyclo-ligase
MALFVEGFAEGCRQSGAVWGGGETPTLKGVVNPDTIVLAGSAVGRIAPKSRRIRGEIRDGDAIVFLASSGVQTNGLSLCRLITERLPRGYHTPIGHGDSRTYGEALLAPSVIYVRFVRLCLERGLPLHYLAHVTGHGWRKLMRAEEPFVYEIHTPREIPALFQFIMEAGPVSLREAYATFNMGVGFAAYVPPAAAAAVVTAAQEAGHDAWIAGVVRRDGARKAVTVPSLGLAFEGDTLQVR